MAARLEESNWPNMDKTLCPDAPKIKINISEWITDIHIYDLTSHAPYTGLGEIRVYGHNPCRCNAAKHNSTDGSGSSTGKATTAAPITTTRDPTALPNATTTPSAALAIDEDDTDDTTTVAAGATVGCCCCCCCVLFALLFFFWAPPKTLVLTFAGARHDEMNEAEITALQEEAVKLVLALAANKADTPTDMVVNTVAAEEEFGGFGVAEPSSAKPGADSTSGDATSTGEGAAKPLVVEDDVASAIVLAETAHQEEVATGLNAAADVGAEEGSQPPAKEAAGGGGGVQEVRVAVAFKRGVPGDAFGQTLGRCSHAAKLHTDLYVFLHPAA